MPVAGALHTETQRLGAASCQCVVSIIYAPVACVCEASSAVYCTLDALAAHAALTRRTAVQWPLCRRHDRISDQCYPYLEGLRASFLCASLLSLSLAPLCPPLSAPPPPSRAVLALVAQ